MLSMQLLLIIHTGESVVGLTTVLAFNFVFFAIVTRLLLALLIRLVE